MWRLRIGAEAGDKTHLFTTNNYAGRQIWEFDEDAGSPEELDEVDKVRQNFSANRSVFKPSADLLWRMQVNLFHIIVFLFCFWYSGSSRPLSHSF